MIYQLLQGTAAAILVAGVVGNSSTGEVKNYQDTSSIAVAIKAGEVGPERAERAKRDKNLTIRKIESPGVPFDFYVVLDFANEYTVMVEKDHLVLLCSGFGGGTAHQFALSEEGGNSVLTFQFETGSGVSTVYDCRYVIDSGIVKSKLRSRQP